MYNEIFKYARQYIKENSKYSPTILKDTPPDKKFPLIIIKEINPLLQDETLKKGEQKFKIVYEIEIFTMNNGNIAKQTITKELKELLINVFFEYYGMNIKANKQIPNIDSNLDRWYLKFEAIIDENKKIYRR